MDEEQPAGETRGQTLQRHKREMAAVKAQIARLSKKQQKEGVAMMEDTVKRQAAELAALESGAAAPAADAASGSTVPQPADDATAALQAVSLQPVNPNGGSASPAAASAVPAPSAASAANPAAPQAEGAGGGEGAGGPKPSKAQKKRAQKAKAESDREIRIREEQSNMGDSSRVLEEQALAAKLKPHGLAVFDIKARERAPAHEPLAPALSATTHTARKPQSACGSVAGGLTAQSADGHCLYRSLEHQAALQSGGAFSGGGGGGGGCDYMALRAMAAKYVREHESDFRPFLDECADDTPEAADSFEKYCREMAETAVWGGQLEIGALAHALRKPICVFSAALPEVTMGSEYKGEPLRVAYLQHAYGLGEHYCSLISTRGDDC